MTASRLLLLVIASTCMPVQAQWGEWSASLGAAIAHGDNVNTAARGRDKKSDEFVEASARIGRSYTFRDAARGGTRLGWQAEAAIREHDDFYGLSLQRYGGSLRFNRKLGLGTGATRVTASVSAHYENTDDKYREAWYYTGSAVASRRLTPRLGGSLRGSLRRHSGEDFDTITPQISSNVYDQDHLELGVRLRYTLRPWLRSRLAVDYLDGEFDSRCGAGSQEQYNRLAALPGVKALALDYSFKGCRWLLDGDGYRVRLAADFRLARSHGLTLQWTYRDIDLDNDMSYATNLYRLDYRYSFR